MANEYRTNNCGELNISNVGSEVKLAGWIQRIRNLGGMTFVDLRDQYGITQIVVADEELKNNWKVYTQNALYLWKELLLSVQIKTRKFQQET